MLLVLPEGNVPIHRDPESRLFVIHELVMKDEVAYLAKVTQMDMRRNALLWHARVVLTPESLGYQCKVVHDPTNST